MLFKEADIVLYVMDCVVGKSHIAERAILSIRPRSQKQTLASCAAIGGRVPIRDLQFGSDGL